MPSFYSEYGEDEFLHSYDSLFFVTPQFYVDAGCGHPLINSNTQFLREMGWSGIHIDGNPTWIDFWEGNMIHAIVGTRERVYFECNPVPVLSRVGEGEPNVDCERLDTILRARNVDEIGLLSVDCEGQEFDVIQSMGEFRPRFIIAEYNTHGIGEDFRAMEYLTANGYKVIHQTIANLIYVRSTPDGN